MKTRVTLSAPGHPLVSLELRALTGADELSLDGIGFEAALGLLRRLSAEDLNDLTISEIDRGLAGLYRMLYGARAECRAKCGTCGEVFEFDLSLPDVIAAQDADRPGPADAQGFWAIEAGWVRAPRPGDLAGDPVRLAERLTEGEPLNLDSVEAFLDKAAPVLSLDIDAPCPACGDASDLRFDLASYLTQRLAQERPLLTRETHLIAARYGWSHAEIMGLSRTDRRAYAELIETERAQAMRRQIA